MGVKMILEPADREQLSHYYELLERYQNLDTDRIMPLLAIRLLCIKHGYGGVMKAMRALGEDAIVLASRSQLIGMVKMWERMIKTAPPPPEIIEGVLENVATVKAAYLDPAVTTRLYKQLGRMRIREDWLSQRDKVAPSKPN